MIQILYAGIFVSITLPVLYSLAKHRRTAEDVLARAGLTGRIILAVCLAVIGAAQLAATGGTDLFALAGISRNTFDLLNSAVFNTLLRTPAHELGHFLFIPLGTTMMILGGSLTELLLPTALFVWFLLSECPRLAAIFLFLASHSMLYIAQYMSTARARDTVLYLSLEQDPETHDWYRLFQTWGVLEKNLEISAVMHYGGLVVMILALAAVIFLPDASNDADEGVSSSVTKTSE